VPVPDAEFGFRPVAFLRTTGGNVKPETLALERTLPRFKVPVSFHAWPAEAGGMKVDRAFFRERARRLHRDRRNLA
jgi:o-succinylbenzoate---CoA ligase